jgi:hypothetical protein
MEGGQMIMLTQSFLVANLGMNEIFLPEPILSHVGKYLAPIHGTGSCTTNIC